MSDRSRDAAEKYRLKQADEQFAKKIMQEQAGNKLDSIFSLFESAVNEFNTDSSNQKILKFSHTPGNSQFHIMRNGREMHLAVSINTGSQPKIRISGAGGLEFLNEIFIKADTSTGNAYFATSDGDRIDIDDAIWKSLNALLEI